MDKFPATTEARQPAFAISLITADNLIAQTGGSLPDTGPRPPGRNGPPRPPRPPRRIKTPVLAVSEQDRIVLFSGREDGTWASITRRHDRAGAFTGRPSAPQALEFSRSVGLAQTREGVVLAYKRGLDGVVGLYLDAARFGGRDGYAFDGVPVLVPLQGLGIDDVGLDLWIYWDDSRLTIAVQTWIGTAPTLSLLTAQATDVGDIAGLTAASAWTVHRIDAGGFDFDAKRVGQTLHLVHRRTPGAMSVAAPDFARVLAATGAAAGLFTDVQPPGPFETPYTHAPLVWQKINLTTLAVTLGDDAVPGGEHPHICAVDPLWVTLNRHSVVAVRATSTGPDRRDKRLELVATEGSKVLASKSGSTWTVSDLFSRGRGALPGHVKAVQAAQQMLEPGAQQLLYATLLDSDPVFCTGVTRGGAPSKGVVELMHHDARLNAFVVSSFALSPGAVQAQQAGVAVLDLNHSVGRAELLQRFGADHPELGQFGPSPLAAVHRVGNRFNLRWTAPVRQGIGGLPVADPVRPFAFFAYSDMGDGGVRAIVRERGEAPPSVPPDSLKTVGPDDVPDLGGGRWIELATPRFLPLDLPRYRAPYSDFLRSVWERGRRIPGVTMFALGIVARELTIQLVKPRAIVHGVQPVLDALPELNALFLQNENEDEAELPQDPPLPVVLNRGKADDLQSVIVDSSPALAGQGAITDPFEVSFRVNHSTFMQGSSYTFTEVCPVSIGARWRISWVLEGGGQAVFRSRLPIVTVTMPEGATEMTVRLRSFARGRRLGTAEETYVVRPSLWGTVTAIYDGLREGGAGEFRSLKADLGALTLDFDAPAGPVSTVTVSWPTTYQGDFRFRAPGTPGQGEVELRLPLRIQAATVTPSGEFAQYAGLIRISDLDVRLRTTQRFTPGVLTSDRRAVDPAQEAPYAELDARAGRVIEGMPDIETIVAQADVGELINLPAALAMKPAGPLDAEFVSVSVKVSLRPDARTILGIVYLAGLLGITGALVAAVIAALAVAGPAGAAAVAIGGGLSILIGALIALGLGWVLFDVILPPILTGIIRDELEANVRARLGETAATLQAGNYGRYTGEGLAEAVATRALAEAAAQGITAPAAERVGRNRLGGQFFRAIVVGADRARIEIDG